MNHPTIIGFILSIFPFLLFCVCVILFFVCFIVLVVTSYLFIFFVLKDIEKKYNTELKIHPSFDLYPLQKSAVSIFIIFMYLNEKNILKNKRFRTKVNPFLAINYKVLEEKKSTIYICFTIHIACFLAFALLGIAALIAKYTR